MINCTFYDNTANRGGALHAYSSGSESQTITEITNSIFYKNSSETEGDQIASYYSNLDIQNTLIEGGLFAIHQEEVEITAEKILNKNPLFLNPELPKGSDGIFGTADDGLHLSPCTSPAVNFGNDEALSALNDLAEKDRIQGSHIDLGAYETIPCERVEMETLELDLCSNPLFVDFEEVEGAIAYMAEITVVVRQEEVITRRISSPPFTTKVRIPRRLQGTTVEVRLAAIFMDQVNEEERINDFSEPIMVTIECDNDLEGRNSSNVSEFQITLFPNPAQEEIQLNFTSEINENIEVQILEVFGKVLKKYNLQSAVGENQLKLEVEQLQSGMYFVYVITSNKVEILQFVKSR